MLPPGIKFLLGVLPDLIFAPIILGIVCYASSSVFGVNVQLSTWPVLLCMILSSPLWLVSKYFWDDLKKKREARAMGAIPPPTIPGKWPGKIDFLLAMFKSETTAYIGDQWMSHNDLLGSTFNINVFWQDKIATSEPEHVKAILATEFTNFEKGDHFKNQAHSLLGVGVFNSDGEMWKFHRTMTRPFFSKDRISHFELFGRHADEAIELMKERLKTGHAIDFQEVVSRFTLDSATEFLFGHCVHSLATPLGYSPNLASSTSESESTNAATIFSQAFGDAQFATAKRGRLNFLWPLFEFWKDKTEEHMKVVDAFIDPILHEAIKKKKALGEVKKPSEKEQIEEDETLLSHLIKYTDDMRILRDEILNIIVAGRDTTAATLTFAVYCLGMHPEVLKRLREEILLTVGPDRFPTYDDLRDMKYLRAVINETLRLYPPVPFDQRASINATTLPNKTPGAKPWYIPARTRVLYSVLVMHRRTDLWGPDAIEFDPDRFLDDRLHKYLTPNPFIFLPFNAGPRICLGQQFAYNEISFMLIRLLQAFDRVELAPDEQPTETLPPASWAKATNDRKSKEKIRPKNHLTIYAHGGLWVRLHEARTVESA